MGKSNKVAALAGVVGIALVLSAFSALPLNNAARAAGSGAASSADLIAASFGDTDAVATPENGAAAKGDLLVPGCRGETWPDISADCLITNDGSPAPAARAGTIGYQTGDSTTVLVRAAAPAMASN
jgi:hypothetical protein